MKKWCFKKMRDTVQLFPFSYFLKSLVLVLSFIMWICLHLKSRAKKVSKKAKNMIEDFEGEIRIIQIPLFFRFYSALCQKTHVHSFQKVRTHTADCFGYGWAVDNYKVFAINAVIYQIGEPAKMKMVLKKC